MGCCCWAACLQGRQAAAGPSGKPSGAGGFWGAAEADPGSPRGTPAACQRLGARTGGSPEACAYHLVAPAGCPAPVQACPVQVRESLGGGRMAWWPQ